jgi:hypothetical protein
MRPDEDRSVALAAQQGAARLALLRPGPSLAVAADVLAGYCIAAPARPRLEETLAAAPLLFASAALVVAAGNVFYACFTPAPTGKGGAGAAAAEDVRAAERGVSTKRMFLLGAALAVAGLFSAMGAAVSAGKLPVYFAAFLFLLTWARAGMSRDCALLGPASAGALRALTLGLGMSAHRGIVYGADAAPFVAAALFFAFGALLDTVEGARGEGGRRFLLLGAAAGVLAVFAGAGIVFVKTPTAALVALAGGAFVAARAWPAVRSLTSTEIARFAEAGLLAGCALDAALCLGPWTETDPVTWALAGSALAVVLPCSALLRRAGGAALLRQGSRPSQPKRLLRRSRHEGRRPP